EDAVEQEGIVVKLALEEAEVAAVKFDPEAFALQVFQPAGPQVAPPMFFDPAADGGFTQITAGLLALNPFVALSLLLALDVDTTLFHGSAPSSQPPEGTERLWPAVYGSLGKSSFPILTIAARGRKSNGRREGALESHLSGLTSPFGTSASNCATDK